MAYVNVREWSVDQVTDWMKGLDSNVTRYITCFLNNGVNGHQLLNVRVDDLEHFGVLLQGHQEIILEAVELLRNFHYELDKENVQTLALRLVCAARGISRDLQLRDIKAQKVPTQTMSDVHNLIANVKPLVQWLDRRPFSVEHEYNNLSAQILQYSYFMVHHTHRDTFAEQPLVSIIELCDKLIKIGNHIVQEVSDPMILQPATLDLANLKKKEQELGFYILASNTAVHQVAEIAFGSPAQTNSKIEVGDEIVQVNYQTIVGWQRKSVLRLLQLSSPDIVLTLKKRPRHTKMYGQIYMQPYRLPSKKRDNSSYPHWNWNFDNIPSPRLFNLPPTNHNVQLISSSDATAQTPLKTKTPVMTGVTDLDDLSESSSEGSDDDDGSNMADSDDQPPALLINDNSRQTAQGRLYPVKPPRMLLQRRNTISGSTLSFSRPTDLIAQFYQELKKHASSNNASASNIRLEREKFKEDSVHIRDKSVSCSYVLESDGRRHNSRPTTVIGGMTSAAVIVNRQHLHKEATSFPRTTAKDETSKRSDDDKQVIAADSEKLSAISAMSLSSLRHQDSSIDFIDEGDDLADRSKMIQINIKDTGLEEVHVNSIIKKFEQVKPPPQIQPRIKLLSGGDCAKLNDLDVEILVVLEKPSPPEIPNKPKPPVFPRSVTNKIAGSAKNRGHFDKAHSTPAYDLTTTTQLAILPPPVLTTEERVYNVEYLAKSIEHEILGHVLNGNGTTKSPNILDVPPKPPPRINKPPAKLPETDFVLFQIDVNSENNNLIANKDFLLNTPNASHSVNAHPTMETNTSQYQPQSSSSNDHRKNISSSSVVGTNQLNYHHPDVVPVLLTSPTTSVTTTPSKCGDGSDYDHFQFTPVRASLSPIVVVVKNPPPPKLLDKHKISTSTNNLVSMIYPMGKGRGAAKKKNSLLARRRNVSVSDVSLGGEVQGFLFQRLRHKQTQNVHWTKRWFVLNSNCLYGFKTPKDAQKADCFIYLSGFTVTVANEVKSRTNAFKVYHTGTVFYFSAENSESQSSWIDLITSATLSSDCIKSNSSSSDQNFYSETDDDEDDEYSSSESNLKTPTEKSSEGGGGRKFNSLKKFTRKRNDSSNNSVSSGCTSLDRKWFFNKTIGSSSKSSPIPVKTDQFRSYRKISTSTTTGNFTSHIPNFTPPPPPLHTSANVCSSPNLAAASMLEDVVVLLLPVRESPTEKCKLRGGAKQIIHNSNPNLAAAAVVTTNQTDLVCNFSTGQAATSSGKVKNESLEGFVTLKELMNRQHEERKLNPHFQAQAVVHFDHLARQSSLIKTDVVYGEIPLRPAITGAVEKNATTVLHYHHVRTSSDCCGQTSAAAITEVRTSSNNNNQESNNNSSCFGKRSCSFKRASSAKNNSLPKQHSKLYKDRSYEMIYCPLQTAGSDVVQFAQNRKVQQQDASPPPHQHTPITGGTPLLEDRFHLNMAAMTAASATSEALIQSNQGGKGKLNKFFGTLSSRQEWSAKRGGSLKKSSAVTVASPSPKLQSQQQRLLVGAAGKNLSVVQLSANDSLPLSEYSWMNRAGHGGGAVAADDHQQISDQMLLGHLRTTPPPSTGDYPGLEYPPVFEPETYSLADPHNTSLALSRNQHCHHK